jgi:8-oxo-dGTP pyrophosphatase MutT (NUDIX family)
MPPVLQKVTAFITRQTGDQLELLVFRHPTAGIQLPAGTVEADEALDAAVLREVREETGLTDVRIIRHLGTLPRALAPRTERHCFHLTTDADTPAGWDVFTTDGGGHIFHCYWTPLLPKPALVSPQDTWLVHVYDQLVASVRTVEWEQGEAS